MENYVVDQLFHVIRDRGQELCYIDFARKEGAGEWRKEEKTKGGTAGMRLTSGHNPSHISGGSSDDPPSGQVFECGPFGAYAWAIYFIARREIRAGV